MRVEQSALCLVVLLPVGQAQLFDTVFTAGLLLLALNANEALFSDATSGSMFSLIHAAQYVYL